MKIKIKMDKKVLAEVPAVAALAGGAAGLVLFPKATLIGVAAAAAAGLRPAIETTPIDAPKPEGYPWMNPAPDVKDKPVAEEKPAAKKTTKAAPAKKATASKSTTAKKSTASKSTTAKKSTSTKAAPAKKATASKSTTAKKSTATKAAPAKKATASKSTTAKKSTATKAAPAKKATASKSTTAKKTTTANGKYQYKYMVDGKAKFLYSWRLVPTDPQPVGKQPCLILLTVIFIIVDSLCGADPVTEQGNILINYLIYTLTQQLGREVLSTTYLNVKTTANGKAHCGIAFWPELLYGKEDNELRSSGIDLCACRIGISDKAYHAIRCCDSLPDSLGVGANVLLAKGNIVKCEYITTDFRGNGICRQLAGNKPHFFDYIEQRLVGTNGNLCAIYNKLHIFSSFLLFSLSYAISSLSYAISSFLLTTAQFFLSSLKILISCMPLIVISDALSTTTGMVFTHIA